MNLPAIEAEKTAVLKHSPFSEPTLVPEFKVMDFEKSLYFYTELVGFSVLYSRPEQKFAMLKIGTSQLMLEQYEEGDRWITGALEPPLGRGINFQIEVGNLYSCLKSLKDNNIELYQDVEEKFYRVKDVMIGQRQFLVQDPDGYLLRICQVTAVRPCVRADYS